MEPTTIYSSNAFIQSGLMGPTAVVVEYVSYPPEPDFDDDVGAATVRIAIFNAAEQAIALRFPVNTAQERRKAYESLSQFEGVIRDLRKSVQTQISTTDA